MRSGRKRTSKVATEHGRERRFDAPTDCTRSDDLSRLVRRIVESLEHHPSAIVIDLSGLRSMNSTLLSAVIYVARECQRVGTPLRLEGVCPLFRSWASTHGVLRHLHLRGLVGDADQGHPTSGE